MWTREEGEGEEGGGGERQTDRQTETRRDRESTARSSSSVTLDLGAFLKDPYGVESGKRICDRVTKACCTCASMKLTYAPRLMQRIGTAMFARSPAPMSGL